MPYRPLHIHLLHTSADLFHGEVVDLLLNLVVQVPKFSDLALLNLRALQVPGYLTFWKIWWYAYYDGLYVNEAQVSYLARPR